MSEDDLKEKVRRMFADWLEANFSAKKNGLLASLNDPKWLKKYHEFLRSAGIEWDQTLNVLNVRRIEDHLGIPHRKGYIRFRDPFVLGPNNARDLEMSVDLANNILVLGMPSSK